MASEPDRGALRDFMREFELRAVMERLEEALPEGEAVPGRSVEKEVWAEGEEGPPADPGDGGAAMEIAGERWAAAQGERIVAGFSTLDELAAALAGRPLAAHGAKSLGGGRHGLLAAAAREGIELALDHDTMLAAYLLEPQRRTYELTELAADAGIGLAEGATAVETENDGQLALGEEVEAGLDPPEEARLVAALAEAQRPRLEQFELVSLLQDVELPLVHVLAAMEREGLKLDAERMAEVGAGFGERIATLEKEIFDLAAEEFTIDLPRQVGPLQPGRVARARPRRRRGGVENDLRCRRRRSRRHRRRGLRHLARGRRRRPALEGEDGQLRHRLRPDRLRPRRSAQHSPQRGRGVRRPLPGAFSGSEGFPGASRRARPGGGLRADADGKAALDPRASLRQPQHEATE